VTCKQLARRRSRVEMLQGRGRPGCPERPHLASARRLKWRFGWLSALDDSAGGGDDREGFSASLGIGKTAKVPLRSTKPTCCTVGLDRAGAAGPSSAFCACGCVHRRPLERRASEDDLATAFFARVEAMMGPNFSKYSLAPGRSRSSISFASCGTIPALIALAISSNVSIARWWSENARE
jgi:hypothetical protein